MLDLLHLWILSGLAGIVLPIAAHLFSRRRFDVLDWGAMQFLLLDPNARRKVTLEDLLLLLIRVGLIVLVTLVLARPWVSAGWLGGWSNRQPRDLAIVLDRSGSMAWQGRNGTPDQLARELAREVIRQSTAGDTLSVWEAGAMPRLIIGPARDATQVLQQLDELPVPAATSELVTTSLAALQQLSRGSNLKRELLIITDPQARGWQIAETAAWQRLDDLRELAAVPPRVWAVQVPVSDFGVTENLTVDRLKLSRESITPGQSIRLSTLIRRAGENPGARMVPVYLELDGVRQHDQTLQVRLPEQGAVKVDFEPRFTTAGSHEISVVVAEDVLPGDNRSDAVVVVRAAISVLLVNGSPSDDPTRSETFFAQAALEADERGAATIRATVQDVATADFSQLDEFAVVVLANVRGLTEPQTDQLLARVKTAGTALLVACGDQLDADRYRSWHAEGRGWMPCRLERIAADQAVDLAGVQLSDASLDLPWLLPFRAERGGSLTEARFSKWWQVTTPAATDDNLTVTAPVIAAKLTTGDPWLITHRHGRGQVAVLTSSLDADWNTLPANADYVPFLHELLLSLSQTEPGRNVEPGQPLVLHLPQDIAWAEVTARDPGGNEQPLTSGGDEVQRTAILTNAHRPGLYRFGLPTRPARTESFAVQPDRSESDLTPLTDGERAFLTTGDRVKFVKSADELLSEISSDGTRMEIGWILLYLFVALLLCESWLTRRMVRGGRAVVVDQ